MHPVIEAYFDFMASLIADSVKETSIICVAITLNIWGKALVCIGLQVLTGSCPESRDALVTPVSDRNKKQSKRKGERNYELY